MRGTTTAATPRPCQKSQSGDKSPHSKASRRRTVLIAIGPLLLSQVTGCGPSYSDRVQGYVEGEFVYVASPLPGAVESLEVQRGSQVEAGDPLFALESTPEKAARDEAQRRLAQARATWEDVKKGRRPSEIESLEAQLKQARAALTYSESEVVRQEPLFRKDLVTAQELERARSTRDQDRQRVAQLEADLLTARLGAREDQIAAAEANVRALEATLAKAQWDLAEKRQAAPQAGLVFDTLFREGEWVPAGRPVVALLPPPNIKVRAFVPEPRIGAVSVGQQVEVTVDGVAEPFEGKVSFISPRAEFTPPVIYSRESRTKLVFMVEIVFDPELAAKLHPGQPVDVDFEQ
jgi:HlyD family secretion protein